MGRRRTGTRRCKVYRSVREKPGNVVYRQRVLQTVTSLRIISLVFRRYDLLIIKIFYLFVLYLRLSTKVLAVLRLSVNPIETLC